MERLFNFRYPKLFLLIIISVLSYYLFSQTTVGSFVKNLHEFSYLGIFIAGLFFSFGFSTPLAVGFFVVAEPSNIFLAAILGGAGALISDLFIFKMIRFSFMDEFKRLEKSKAVKEIHILLNTRFLSKFKNYLLFVFAGIVIASPLPDELGVTMLAGMTKIKTIWLAIISFCFNTLGILIMLLI